MGWKNSDGGWEQHARMLRQLKGVAHAGTATLTRFAADVRALLRNGLETRRLLSEQVYQVPDEWLDEVVRLRMDDLSEDRRAS